MPLPTPQNAAAKWQNRLKSAQTEIRQGVEAVTESPTEKAAAKSDKWLAGVQNAHANGKFADRLRGVSLQEWKDRTINIGLGRIAAGVDAAVPDVQDFYTELFSYEAQLQSRVEAMPDTNLQDSINRMVAWAEGMSQFHRS
jgi:hypothetical protein|tara:strand:+ start:117 stop:539 length:423 start_codon:yes stop_codon:yes gene_type:complete